MKFITKQYIWVLVAVLLIANGFFFLHGLMLSEEINKYDTSIKKLQVENTDLEKKLDQQISLNYATSMATQLNFTEKTHYLYLDSPAYALNR